MNAKCPCCGQPWTIGAALLAQLTQQYGVRLVRRPEGFEVSGVGADVSPTSHRTLDEATRDALGRVTREIGRRL